MQAPMIEELKLKLMIEIDKWTYLAKKNSGDYTSRELIKIISESLIVIIKN